MNRDEADVREFLAEASAYLDASEPILATLQNSEGGTDPDISSQVAAVFRAFHSIKGVAGFLSFSQVQEVTHRAEETLDRVRTGKRAFDRDLGSALLEACDLLRKYFRAIETGGEDSGDPDEKAALVSRLGAFCAAPKESDAPATLQESGSGAASGWLFEWLRGPEVTSRFPIFAREWMESVEQSLVGLLDAPSQVVILGECGEKVDRLRLHALAFGYQDAAALAGRLVPALKKAGGSSGPFDPAQMSTFFTAGNLLKELFLAPGAPPAALEKARLLGADLDAIATGKSAPVQTAGESGKAKEAPAPNASGGGKNDIRVSLEKLDQMVDLIEELGVVSTGVVYAADQLEAEDGMRRTAASLRKITEELQEITVSIRMVPLASVFRKMIRLVGDVSAKLGKKVHLEIVGEGTELDKDAVESLQDPLVHILRNCVDHGLELPEERRIAGKPENGIIQLQAWHSGGEAWITVSDDGRGISKEKILAKAVAQGLVAAGAAVSDAEALDFIFHPGFSLAKEVTEFSGRGVGMDVVRRNIQGLKGRVEIASKLGQGTTFTIRIPMANALTESMLVRVGAVKYVLRVATIREIFKPPAGAVTCLPDGQELVSLRGHLYPVIRVHQLHRLPGAETELERGLVVLVENRGKQSALFVDEILGKIQAVIKPPPSYLKRSTTLAGCSIIGTGSDAVALALDINALDEKAAEAVAGRGDG